MSTPTLRPAPHPGRQPVTTRRSELLLLSLLGLLALCVSITGSAASAAQVRVAVASNFAGAMEGLTADFEAATGHRVSLSFGSTGKHYAQIRHGAPYDAFFAADARRPRLLEEEGHGVPGSRFTYAIGRLVLWSPREGLVDDGGAVLRGAGFRHLAIANPRLAPYGRAAREVLEALGLWPGLRGRLVQGENIAQTFQFVASGNADLGFVALSQVRGPGGDREGSQWEVPPELFAPIAQEAVLLRDHPAARDFLEFVRSDRARALIRAYGYEVPGAE